MEQAIMIVMAAGALLGGLDKLIGNKFGLGEKFEEGFRLLGAVALAQAGIICLAPVLSELLGPVVKAAYRAIGQDPGMFGSILAIDMGGYQMAGILADDPLVGRFSGIVAASMFGCTITFTIPVGMGFLPKEKQDAFARGILYGLMVMPVAMIFGALLCGMTILQAVWVCLPILVMAGLMGVGLVKFPQAMFRGFQVFAKGISALITLGLTIGAVQYMSGWTILPGLVPLEEAMEVVSSIGIVMLGSLPVAEIIQRLLKRPMAAMGKRVGMTDKGIVNLLICYVAATSALASLKDMEKRDISVSAAFVVCGAGCLSSHLGFALAVDAALVTPMMAAKVLGSVLAAVLVLMIGMKKRSA